MMSVLEGSVVGWSSSRCATSEPVDCLWGRVLGSSIKLETSRTLRLVTVILGKAGEMALPAGASRPGECGAGGDDAGEILDDEDEAGAVGN